MNGAQLDSPRTKRIDSLLAHRKNNPKMNNPKRRAHALLPALAAAMIFLPFPLVAELQQQPATPATDPTSPQTTLPPQSDQPQSSAPLRVMVGKSLLINTT
jgi:hypothetical protein